MKNAISDKRYAISKMWIIFALVLVCLILPQIAQAGTYYVDANGATGGSGTFEDPYHRQGNGIMSIGSAGDIIYLRDGYYGEINTNAASNSDYRTIQAQPGHKPGFRRISLSSGSKWIFRGLSISPELAPTYSLNGYFVNIGSGCNYITIEDCNIYSVQDVSGWDKAAWATLISGAKYAIYSQSPNTIIRRNTIRNVFFGIVLAYADGSIIEYNTMNVVAADGINIGWSDNITIQYNTFTNFYKVDSPAGTGNHGDMIQLHRGADNTAPPISNITIIGNIGMYKDFTDSSPFLDIEAPQGISNFDRPSHNWTVYNNIVFTNQYNGIVIKETKDCKIINNIAINPLYPATSTYNCTISNAGLSGGGTNIWRNNMANAFGVVGTGNTFDHNIDTDSYGYNALFVDYQDGDLRHKEDSPAIDAGSADLAPDRDILGTPRPQGAGYDIGAYEYVVEVYYVRSDATGAGDGSDWTNAYTKLPDKLERGSTYYIADGNYTGHTFDDDEDGEKYIYIKKAIQSAHGTDTGWDSQYGDGTATFNLPLGHFDNPYPYRLTFLTGYYIFDGQTGGGPGNWKGDVIPFGFKVIPVLGANLTQSATFIVFGDGWSGTHQSNYTRVSHVELTSPYRSFYDLETAFTDHHNGDDANLGSSNITISYCYIHDFHEFLFTTGTQYWTLEYNYFDKTYPYSATAGGSTAWEIRGDDYHTVRYNMFVNIRGTAVLDFKKPAEANENYGWEIYGNVFYDDNAHVTDPDWPGIGGNGIIGDAGNEDASGHIPNAITNDMRIYNNAFVNKKALNSGIKFGSATASNNLVYNNIWYNTQTNAGGYSIDRFFMGIEHNYNWFYGNTKGGSNWDSTLAASENNSQLGTGDPFVDWQNGDFHLSTPTTAGYDISSLDPNFAIDMYGNTRGADGVWDRGAIEYVEGVILYGDVSGEGEVSAYDAALTAQAAVGLITLTADQTKAADVSGEGEVSAYDAALIAQYAVGLIDKFPVEE
jgi:parallel beta-helix repeat protein